MKWYSVWAVFLLFLLITLAMTFPLITQMTTHFAGVNIDVWLNLWGNWWTGKALGEGLPFYHTDYILHPHGVSLYFHSFSHTNTFPRLLLEPWIGPLAAYNLTVMLDFVLLGLGVYLLVRELTGHGGAGVVSGLAATFAPYHVWECVHPNIFSTQYIPLALWALVVTFRRRPDAAPNSAQPWRRGMVVGIFLALAAFSSWHQPIYAVVILGPYLAWQLVVRGRMWDKQVWPALLTAALIAGTLVGPVVLPLLREQLRAGYAEPEIAWVANTDALAWITPSFLHPLWGAAVRPLYERFSAPNRPAFVGYTVLMLALLGMRRWWRERDEHGWLIISTLLALMLALGTNWAVNGEVILSDLPWYAPIIGFIRTPVRLNLMLGQCLAILAGFGVTELLSRTAQPRRRGLVVVLLSALLLFEFLAWPFPSTRAYVPPFYTQLAHETGDFAIVEAPLDRQSDKFYMYWQTIHEKPMVNGHVSRPPASAFDFIEGNMITRAFAQRVELLGRAGLGAALNELANANVRYILIHKRLLPPDLAADWIAALAMHPVYEDDELVVCTTAPQLGTEYTLTHVLSDRIGLGIIQSTVTPTRTLQGGRIDVQVHWGSRVAPEQDYAACLNLVNSAGETAQSHCEPLHPAWPTSRWRAGEVVIDDYTFLADLTLPPGPYSLTVGLADRSTLDLTGRAVPIGQLTVNPLRPDHPLQARWQDGISLHGYDLHQSTDQLDLTLYWQATREVTQSYKVFVHVLNANGEIVAQHDAIPCTWQCPTNQWLSGEIVPDPISIPLVGLGSASDQYRIAVGLYHPRTRKRLILLSPTDASQPGNRLFLPDTVPIG